MPLHYKIGFDEDAPKTAEDATPIGYEDVIGMHVIRVLGREHRNANLS